MVSHDANSIDSTPVDHSSKILLLAEHADVVGIDEAQFFNKKDKPNLVEVSLKLKNKGIRVIINGLDMDYNGKPFG